MSRKNVMAGNWKMNTNHLEAIQMVQKLSYRLDIGDYERVEVVVCPPFTSLRSTQTVIETDHLPIQLGAQNVDWHESGAFTGEVSPLMLAKLGVRYVIVGHSERRQLFGETDDVVSKKVNAVFNAGMIPILCVGETEEEREAGNAESKVTAQVTVQIGRRISSLHTNPSGRSEPVGPQAPTTRVRCALSCARPCEKSLRLPQTMYACFTGDP